MHQEEQVLPNEDDAGLCGEEYYQNAYTVANQNAYTVANQNAYTEAYTVANQNAYTVANQNAYTVANQNAEVSMESMIAAYLALDKIPEDLRDLEYKEIFALIMTYLKHHCCHEFVYDYIDISPDYGCSITYCQKCGLS